MSAPGLPASFGNYALGDGFHEVVAPAAVSWLPQTSGWGWLAVVLLLFAAHRGNRRLRTWYANRYRREASARLRAMHHVDAGPAWLGELNQLLKLTALAAFPRPQVAGLSGEDWVAFLNAQCTEPPFSEQHVALLASGPYLLQVPEQSVRHSLLAASQRWVETHRGPADV